jgi:tetratricopeptide (TPR) repeat protein
VSLYDNHYVTACYEMFKKFYRAVNEFDPTFNKGYAYLALCCYDLGKMDEFQLYLRKAVENNPQETRLVLGCLFPQDMEVEGYCEYMKEKLNN